MAKPGTYSLTKNYDIIGFVYPVYFSGLPKIVIEFMEHLNVCDNKNTYYHSIATYGRVVGNAVYQIYELLYKRYGIKINYG
jgi:hypothetical protein